MRIAVIGTGYLGTTHAACMAQIGHDVLGVDIDPGKVAKLQSGEVPFFEPGIDNLVRDNLASGRLRFTDSFVEAADFADLVFLTVGTPQCETGLAANLSYLHAAIDALSPHLNRPALVVGKSTVPVGTAERLARRTRSLAPAGDDIELAWNPEFLREGFAVHDTLHPDRIVVGVEHAHENRAAKTLAELYRPLSANSEIPFLVTSLATAELAKVAANAFLATKISFINAISEVCEATSADVTMLAGAIGVDKRIGREFLDAGLGFGGGCLPKDIRAFTTRADELGLGDVVTFLQVVDNINMRQRGRVIDATREICGSLVGTRAAVLGVAFKPNSDDVRDSPALDVAGQLQLQGAIVSVFDPKAMDNAQQLFPTLNYALSTVEACKEADVVLILTEWNEFRKLQPEKLEAVTRSKRIIDARNCLDPQPWRAAGWNYRSFGRP
ncbi:UDP-glucose/GDP-mannose dehydrogenase family protein [Mycobacterium sp.]|jgi:UDPglucose 6-dehydrogenase|uniref:UDP-glucose dehydrogenase family protein n=1 Tax=Mycobacterium sp. TaxID=1785 RepID=UPI002CFA1A18|nr:UDP-glucose/GDP-mannose dehydrogenase family protein [Mycobacterium sp.]HXB89174.1 UDP-glucose/GDP-mannose dehydrogenase family protein [Mycobacterium sp.]